jgi:DNA-binding MarR family transcriptional regulator
MNDISTSLQFFLNLSKAQLLLIRRFDGSLGGISLSEFMILYALQNAPDGQLRRVDLATKVGYTASGITRLLLPMEKIGLVKKEVNPRDARVSIVMIAPGGKRKLDEALERAELLTQEMIPASKVKKIEELSTMLKELIGTFN